MSIPMSRAAATSDQTIGKVFLVGAGPGDPELLTMKAARLIAEAEVIVHDRLVSADILATAPASAERIDVGKRAGNHPVPQEEINEILIRQAMRGRTVVRLKGGDPFIFGRGSEEALALRAAGIRCDVVPGITAAQGCAAATGVPLTHRGLANSVRFITGHCRADTPLEFDWSALADPATTLVIYMGAANIAEISDQLRRHGMPGNTPVLAIANGTMRHERRIVSQLAGIVRDVSAARLDGPLLFIIGEVVSLYASGEVCPALQSIMSAPGRQLRELAHA